MRPVTRALACLSLLLAFTTFPTGQSTTSQQRSKRPNPETYGPPRILAVVRSPDITESSGLVASQVPGVYWTHNDSGDGPFLYAVDETGASRGVWKVTGANAIDWEDIAAGPGPQSNRRYLYIGDIGDNDSNRSSIVVYRVPEPTISAASAASSKRRPETTEPSEAIRLRFPDGAHDAETLLVHPVTGDLYIINKVALSNPTLYKAPPPLNGRSIITMVRIGDLRIPSLLGGIVTGGDISPDGRRVALCDYLQGYELVLPSSAKNFDDIWKQPIATLDVGKRKQGEAIAYRLDGKALLTTSEGRQSPLIQIVRR